MPLARHRASGNHHNARRPTVLILIADAHEEYWIDQATALNLKLIIDPGISRCYPCGWKQKITTPSSKKNSRKGASYFHPMMVECPLIRRVLLLAGVIDFGHRSRTALATCKIPPASFVTAEVERVAILPLTRGIGLQKGSKPAGPRPAS
jgi:hypothetical protein